MRGSGQVDTRPPLNAADMPYSTLPQASRFAVRTVIVGITFCVMRVGRDRAVLPVVADLMDSPESPATHVQPSMIEGALPLADANLDCLVRRFVAGTGSCCLRTVSVVSSVHSWAL
jgi:hypothetical protein